MSGIHRRGRGRTLKKTTTAKLEHEQLKRRVVFKTAEDIKWKKDLLKEE